MTPRWILPGILVCLPLFLYAQSPILKLTPARAHQLTLEQTPDAYRIVTTGTDPYVFSEPLGEALVPGERVLTFEYFAPAYLDHFQVFFGPEVSENRSISSELGIREGWTAHSVRIPRELAEWGKKGDFLRFDFGRNAGYTIQIRGIRFREPNEAERQDENRIAAKKKEEERLTGKLKTYLDETFEAAVQEVKVTSDEVLISGKLPSGQEKFFLAEALMEDDLFLKTDFENVVGLTARQGRFTVKMKRYPQDRSGSHDRLLSRWVIVSKAADGYRLRSHARYADAVACTTTFGEDRLRGKKGIGGFHVSGAAPVSDVDSLGITSVTVNMWITQMMRSKPAENHLPFSYNGTTYYADRKWVEDMDRTLGFCARKKVIVSAIILIDKAVNCADKEIGKIFEHPDCDPSGIYSMANMTSREGVTYYAAAIDFLAKRYNTDDNRHGRIHHWIVHNEVDAGWVWTNMGEKSALRFMDTYHKSMRLIHNIARQYNPYSKTFISLTHFWAWTEDRHFYHSDELLDILLDFSRTEGDFEWAIAHHPYPQSLFEPKSWLDDKAEFRLKTPLITFRNIEVLDAWVRQPRTFFLGKKRRMVFLSEQGPNSKDYSEQNLREQAAGMAYVWKKIKDLDAIDAFQFHNWIDNRGEGGLRIGLRRFPDDKAEPLGKKPVWYVFRDIGTEREDAACAFALPIIGISDWDEARYKGPIGQ